MYRAIGFNGTHEDSLQAVIDNGTVLETGQGNWNLLEYNGVVYYMALINTTARSGVFGSMDHSTAWKSWKKP